LPNTPLVLIIRDGWGTNPNPEHDAFNAVKIARTPVADRLMLTCPWTLIKTSGEDVGIPDGTMGNSEVGHQNIGAGRMVDQESVAITKACRGGLEHIPAIADAITRAVKANAAVHFMGINSDAGVHGLLEHLYAGLRACAALGAKKVFVHLFTDGRDTGPYSGLAYCKQVEAACAAIGAGRVATVIGRYYAMDRDSRWERVSRAYAALTGRNAAQHNVSIGPSATDAIQAYYDAPTNPSQNGDEFIEPCMIGANDAAIAESRIGDGDTVIFYNYRGDRPREISYAFVFPEPLWTAVKPSPDSGVRGFDRGPLLDLRFVTLTAYEEALSDFVRVAFPKPPKMADIAGEWLAKHHLTQFRSAETEKYPHVTFFFNDYREAPFEGEHRQNPPSPKVATYDLMPEMSAFQVRDCALARLAAPDCESLFVVNFANADMVGHTGVLAAAVRACEVVDSCVGALIDATLARGGSLIVTADHGNAEQMWDPPSNAPHTAHTTFDVPLILVGPAFTGRKLRGDQDAAGWFNPLTRAARGRLADVMPTAFDMMGLAKPAEMSGQSLLV